jgi:endo-1,4-beta-mannosidase
MSHHDTSPHLSAPRAADHSPPTQRYLRLSGKSAFLLGVNYWSRVGGPRMWERFDEAAVRAEVRQMRAMGMNSCRSFAFLPTFMPAPPAVAPEALERFRAFLGICNDEGLATAPSLLVGHMSGENYDFPGQAGRSPYTDETVRGWQRALGEAVARAAAGAPAVYAWILSNEMPLWGLPSDVATIGRWVEEWLTTLRGVAPTTPVGIGDGFMNAKGGQNGFDPWALVRPERTDAPTIDYLGPHAYYGDLDPMRAALNAEFEVRTLLPLGKPVVFEEFGGSAAQVAEDHQAAFYRETILGVLAIGGAGAQGWCYSDFGEELYAEGPYHHHAFELGFGVTRADGSEKPVGAEYRAIAALLDGLDLDTLYFPPPRAALVVPSYLYTTYPFSWEDRAELRRTLLQAYTLACKAGVQCAVLTEPNGPGGDAEFHRQLADHQLLLLPSTQKLRQPTWQALRRRAQDGATVYWSYFSGPNSFHQGAWLHDFEGLVGARHRLRYGCFDLPPPEVTLRCEFGELTTGTQVGTPYGRSLLPVELGLDSRGKPTTAEPLGYDEARRPSLLRNPMGKGAVYFLNHPWEHYLAARANVNESDTSHQLYRWLAERAGLIGDVERRLTPADPRVHTHRVLQGRDELLFVFNRSWNEVGLGLSLPQGRTSLLLGGRGEQLAPKEVRVYRITGAIPTLGAP